MTFTHNEPGTSADTWRADPRWSILRNTAQALDEASRLVVVAAHPDDESAGAGGLVAMAVACGVPVDLLVLTDGEGSHPDSVTCSQDELAARRRDEARAAATALGSTVELTLFGLPDGGLAERCAEITTVLVDRLGDARDVLLLAPWRHDGHPDHETAGRAAAAAAVRTGAKLLEYPVWFWHWGNPGNAPWDRFVALQLDDDAVSRKSAAVAAHRSQVAPLSPTPGDEVLLGPALLEHFAGSQEVYVEEQVTDPILDELHGAKPDPWGTAHRWYELRKRDLLLAMLPRERFNRGLELGCSRGELAADLAERCDFLVATDSSPAAINLARTVVPTNVEVAVLDLPSQWPSGIFDLVVLSEVGYFLSPVALEQLMVQVTGSLTEHGVVVLCHWRHPIDGWVLDGPEVHARALRAGLPALMARYCDDDVEILVLAPPGDRPDPDE